MQPSERARWYGGRVGWNVGRIGRRTKLKYGDKPPWLDSFGAPLPTSELQRISASWSRETWAEYLHSIETPLKEKLGVAADSRFLAETYRRVRVRGFRKRWGVEIATNQASYYEALYRSEIEEEEDELHVHLRMGVRTLTNAEYSVVIKYYWEGLSEYAIARFLRNSRPTVQTLRNRAIQKLKVYMLSFAPIGEIRRRYKNPVPAEKMETVALATA